MPGPRPSEYNAHFAKKAPVKPAPKETVQTPPRDGIIDVKEDAPVIKDTDKEITKTAPDKEEKKDATKEDKKDVAKEEKAPVKQFVMPEIKQLTYTVEEGDHFHKIASIYGVATEDLARENGLPTSAKLSVGQKIKLPLSARLVPESKRKKYKTPAYVKADFDPSKGQTYTVKSGDYLYKIAKNYGTTVKAIRVANSLKSDRLEIGQKLLIPSKNKPITPVKPDPETNLFNKPEKPEKETTTEKKPDKPVVDKHVHNVITCTLIKVIRR